MATAARAQAAPSTWSWSPCRSAQAAARSISRAAASSRPSSIARCQRPLSASKRSAFRPCPCPCASRIGRSPERLLVALLVVAPGLRALEGDEVLHLALGLTVQVLELAHHLQLPRRERLAHHVL